MAGDDAQERTEDATEKRKQDARDKGQVAHSRDASTVIIFLTAVVVFLVLRDYMVNSATACIGHFFHFHAAVEMTPAMARDLFLVASRYFLQVMTPLMLMIFVAGAASNILQVGFIYAPQKLEVKFDRLDIVKGFQKIFSLRQLMEGAKNLIKLGIIITIIYFAFKRELLGMEALIDTSPRGILDHMLVTSLKITFQASIFLVALGIFDFAYQRWEHSKSLRMSRQELKDEMKQQQGDPLIKQRIRQIQMERARQRMMGEVPKANVIITNPTHLAVAIQYDFKKMGAPRVVAKGAGFVAEKIRQIAQENDIPIVENKPVARILYKTVKIGQEVPANLYKAIAGILAYVYRTAHKKPDWF